MVDDHALFRESLARLLSADPDFELVGVEGTREGALEALSHADVDVLLLDYMLGSDSAADLVATLQARDFKGRILLVTAGLPDRDALQMLGAGVAGIFNKQHAAEELKRSIRDVVAGKALIDEQYLRRLVQVAVAGTPRPPALSERERQILGYLIEGLANKEIAAALHATEGAVKSAMQVLFTKTGVRTRSQLVRVALERFRNEL
jgi:two-component system, NarL family, nitrate/nitrite response regulator NarL